MKPKPLASLNHFTLPVVRMFGTSSFNCVGVPCLRYLSDYCLFAAEMAAFFAKKPKKTWQTPRSLYSSLAPMRNRCASGFKPNQPLRGSQQKRCGGEPSRDITLTVRPPYPPSEAGSRKRRLVAHSWADALRLSHRRRLHRSPSWRESARRDPGCARIV